MARRSIILSIPVDKHKPLAEAMKKARESMNLLTNEELIVEWLVRDKLLPKKFKLFDKVKK